MSYTVSVSLAYRRDCAICLSEAESTAIQAIRDRQVTQVTLRVVPKCLHNPAQAAPPPSPAALRAAGQAVLLDDLRLGQLPLSDVNGDDPDAVESAIRGFDPEGR